jgi:XisH protein
MAKDLIHNLVKTALEKADWLVTHDPYPLKVGGFDMEVDLGAESLVAAQRGAERIAVEIKTFAGLSKVYDFHLAIGQFVDYRIALQQKEPDRQLYLAITADIYDDFFQRPFVQTVIATLALKLIVVEPNKAEIVQWIS